MKVIWKYPLKITDEQTIAVPKESEFLSVLEQYNTPVMYYKVDPEMENEIKTIQIVGTGHVHNDDSIGKYLGSISTKGGQLIWHIFEK